MKRLKYTPYYFNTKYEYKTHKYIGRDYGDFKTADKGILGNFTRFLRRLWNKDQKSYKVCNTYTEWQMHVEDIIRRDFSNYEDFLHWLYFMKRESRENLKMVEIIQIPAYIVIFSLSISMFGLEHITLEICMIIFFLIGGCVIYLINANSRVHFFDDIIEIAKAEAPPKS